MNATGSRVPKKFEISGCKSLVTGASSGIGAATARSLAARGALVAIAARRTAELERLAREIDRAGHPSPVVVTADLSEPGSIAPLAEATIDALGGLDLLVNNAAMHVVTPLVEMDLDLARSIYETNLWSPLRLSLALLPALRNSLRGGSVVNVTSAAGYMSPDRHGIYGSSKAAAAALTQIMRIELRREGVSVTEVVPGPVETVMLDASRQAPFGSLALRFLPPGTPDGMAEKIVEAVERRSARTIFPWHTVLPVVQPGFGRWAMRMVSSFGS